MLYVLAPSIVNTIYFQGYWSFVLNDIYYTGKFLNVIETNTGVCFHLQLCQLSVQTKIFVFESSLSCT